MEEARAWSEVLPAYEDRGLNMVMISIDPFETEESIEAFNSGAGLTEPLPTVINGGGDIARRFGANALETTIILDENGEEVYRDVAVTDAGTLRAELDRIL
ncbi:MAG: TlpA family protein disulfide reductase [Rubrobacteraceae bacterium]